MGSGFKGDVGADKASAGDQRKRPLGVGEVPVFHVEQPSKKLAGLDAMG